MAMTLALRRLVMALTAAATVAANAVPCNAGVQHLINPGEEWASRAARIRPGDEVILMPGRHRDASFEALHGTPEAPIVIRGISTKRPSIIVAEREGIRVRHAKHLIIRDLEIERGTVSGISIGGVGGNEDGEGELSKLVRISNVTIRRIGPRGLRHGVLLQRVSDARVEQCRIEGWGGSAIEVVASTDVSIEACRLAGLEDHGQLHGIRVRAGSDRVNINRCELQDAGELAIVLGGASDLSDFPPLPASPAPQPAKAESRFECARTQVEHCLIRGSRCAITFVSASDCTVRNCTMINLSHCIVAIVHQKRDQASSPSPPQSQRNVFGSNLAVWAAGALSALAEMAGDANQKALVLEDNLWWSPDLAERRATLGALPGAGSGTQVMDVDPALDERGRPTNPQAQAYGVTD